MKGNERQAFPERRIQLYREIKCRCVCRLWMCASQLASLSRVSGTEVSSDEKTENAI
jgi:hypothetical protein